MKTITEYVKNDTTFADLPDGLKDGVLFDIETTGFKAEYNPIYLIGCANACDDGYLITQFLAESRSDERELLDAFISYITEISNAAEKPVPLITFNGNRFDIPYVDRRTAKYGGSYCLAAHPKYDIYRFASKNKTLFGLPDLKQKSLERFIGIERDDMYSGGELIDVVKEYHEDHDPKKERLLLLHNNEDVKGMIALLTLFNLSEVALSENITIDDIMTDEDAGDVTVIFSGALGKPLPAEFTIHEEGFHIKMGPARLKGAIKPYTGTLRLYFSDTSSYVYLIDEKKIVPKLIAADIPKDRKRKAEPAECFAEKEGVFIRIPSSGADIYDTHRYIKEHKAKEEYAALDMSEGISKEWLSLYISDLLRERICTRMD